MLKVILSYWGVWWQFCNCNPTLTMRNETKITYSIVTLLMLRAWYTGQGLGWKVCPDETLFSLFICWLGHPPLVASFRSYLACLCSKDEWLISRLFIFWWHPSGQQCLSWVNQVKIHSVIGLHFTLCMIRGISLTGITEMWMLAVSKF